MADLPENLFPNIVWNALHTKHSHFALRAGDACRYPTDVAPFAAVAAPTPQALKQVHSLLAPSELVYLIGESYPRIPELTFRDTFGVLQMVLPVEVALPEESAASDSSVEIVPLNDANADEMVALTALAFPGYFRRRTCQMGSYYGVRSGAELIAMGGERLMLDDYSEISGVCTHPAHRGKGLAASLIWRLVRNHRRDGLVSWLHVGSANRRAIELYRRMGFKKVREVALHPISRKD